MKDLFLSHNKKKQLENGCVYLITLSDYKQGETFIKNNSALFIFNKYKYGTFDQSILSIIGINFLSFNSLFKRFGFSKAESKKALIEMKYYVRKELEKRNDSESQIQLVLEKYSLNKNASGLWNIAKLVLWFIISKKCSQTILIRCNGIGYYNIIGSYQILTEMLSGTALTAIMLYIDSNLAENDIKLEKLTETTFRSFMGLKEGDSLNYRGR